MGLRLGRIEGADKLDQALEVIGPAPGRKRPDVFEGEVADDLVDAPGMALVLGIRLLHCVLHPYGVVWMTIRRRVASVNTVPYRWPVAKVQTPRDAWIAAALKALARGGP